MSKKKAPVARQLVSFHVMSLDLLCHAMRCCVYCNMNIKKVKARNFAFILYPESIPSDWKVRLETLGVCMAISPLHDKDKSEIEGQEYKKPHYHVVYIAKNPVTVESIRLKIKRCLGVSAVNHVEIVDNVENMYLYLTHESKDAFAKNKHVYSKSDIVLLNDFDIDRYVTLDEAQKKDLKVLIMNLINKKHIVNSAHLLDFVDEHGAEYQIRNRDVAEIIYQNAGGLRLLFDAQYQMGYRYLSSKKLIKNETGEIVDDETATNGVKK